MIIEFFPLTLKRAGENPKELLSFLKEKGFKIENINEETGKVENIDDEDKFLNKYIEDQNIHTNILVTRGVK